MTALEAPTETSNEARLNINCGLLWWGITVEYEQTLTQWDINRGNQVRGEEAGAAVKLSLLYYAVGRERPGSGSFFHKLAVLCILTGKLWCVWCHYDSLRSCFHSIFTFGA